MKVQPFPGGWYADALPTGEYVVLIADSHLQTHRGRVDFLDGQNLLFPRCTNVGTFRFAGQLHREDQNAEWRADIGWWRIGPSYGVSPVIYDAQGRLHQARREHGSQGFRFVDASDRIWTGDETYYDPARQLNEYTVLPGGIVVGQDHDTDRAIVIDPAGVRRVLADGRCRFIRASRQGDRLAVAMWREAKRDALVIWLTVAELAQLPTADAPVPSPKPPPSKEPEPMPPAVATDEIDLGPVIFRHTDIRNWPIASRLTDVQLPEPGSAGILCRHTKAGKWPVSEGAEGVLWIVAQVGGQWYAATCEWLKPGQTWKPKLAADNIGAHTEVEPLASWRPQPGEVVGVMVSTTGGRDKKRHTVAERSQVVRAIWPGAVSPPRPEPPPAPSPAPAPPPVVRPDYGAWLDAATAIRQTYRDRHGREPGERDLAHHLYRLAFETRRWPDLEAVLEDV